MNDDIANFEQYARRFPRDVAQRLRTMRRTVHQAAPQATETISYRMPAFKLKRILVWYGAHAEHIGFYPGAARHRRVQAGIVGVHERQGFGAISVQ